MQTDGEAGAEVWAPRLRSRGTGELIRHLGWRTSTSALLFAAAGMNLALTPEHFAPHLIYGSVRSGSLAQGTFFVTASVTEILLGTTLLLRPSPRVFRVGALVAIGLLAGWLATRASAAPLVPQPWSATRTAAGALELAAVIALLVGLPIGGSSLGPPRFARGWAALAGPTFALMFLLASGALAHVPFDLEKQGPTPWIHADTSLGFGFLSPWISIAFSGHVLLATSWAVLVFLVVAGTLFALTVGMTLGLARCAGTCRPQAKGVAAATPAFVAVPTCCGAALPIGATLGGSTLVPLTSATPWVLLATVALLSASLTLLARRWRAALRAPRTVSSASPLGHELGKLPTWRTRSHRHCSRGSLQASAASATSRAFGTHSG